MIIHEKQPGYILVLTLLILSISVILVTRMVNKGITFSHFSQLATDREQAKLLAESGIQIAMSELMVTSTKADQALTAQLTAWLPLLNTWQTFKFTQSSDGFDGVCQIYITCEEGKIDLNSLYDTQKKIWRKDEAPPKALPQQPAKPPFDAKKMIALLGEKLTEPFGGKNPVEILDKAFKEYGKIEDLSVLLATKDSAPKKMLLFSRPPEKEGEQKIAITDIFTVFTNKKNIQPLMLSPGIIKALGLKTPLRTKEALNFIKNIKSTMAWETVWRDTLAPWYGMEYNNIAPEIRPLFASSFEGKTFSVVSYGTIGTVTQKLCVIIQQQGGSPGQQQPHYVIKRWYWL